MTTWPNIYLQDSSSPVMEQLILFHDHIMFILMMIVVMVIYMMMNFMFNKNIDRNILEGQTIELIWTLTPAIALLFIATPSLRLLYLMDDMSSPMMTTKAVGHQWYWSYEYSDFNNLEFDSYLINDNLSYPRMLEVDNHMTLPSNTFIRMVVTSDDVIHSWTLPSAGMKVDGTPGRLNQSSMILNRNSLMYGQCSEICGMNHSFMPIIVEAIPMNMFIKWTSNK